MYLVEVLYAGPDLAGPMAELREWLDMHQIEPSLFTMTIGSKNVIFRLQFAAAADADAVLRAFDGQTIDGSAPAFTTTGNR